MSQIEQEVDASLRADIAGSLDATLAVLRLEPKDEGWFEAPGTQGMFNHIYGGQLLGQSIVAACATVPDMPLHSLHGYFMRSGDPHEKLRIQVERLRDGRSMATRRVNIFQQDRQLFSLLASFHRSVSAAEWEIPPADLPGIKESPMIQHWAANAPNHYAQGARTWISNPPPAEMRIPEPPRFMGGENKDNIRTHWMRLPKDIGTEPVLHQALLAYCSDYLLMDMVFHRHPGIGETEPCNGTSLDHSLWFHRPVRFDQWHSYTQTACAIVSERGLARGEIRNERGELVATAAQEVMVFAKN